MLAYSASVSGAQFSVLLWHNETPCPGFLRESVWGVFVSILVSIVAKGPFLASNFLHYALSQQVGVDGTLLYSPHLAHTLRTLTRGCAHARCTHAQHNRHAYARMHARTRGERGTWKQGEGLTLRSTFTLQEVPAQLRHNPQGFRS